MRRLGVVKHLLQGIAGQMPISFQTATLDSQPAERCYPGQCQYPTAACGINGYIPRPPVFASYQGMIVINSTPSLPEVPSANQIQHCVLEL
jgi:hypothetical protein